MQWGPGAVGTGERTGPRLADVLGRAGIMRGAREVIFGGADRGSVDGSPRPVRFERSLTVADALESGALLAYAMNGQPLPARHGYPVRLVVPGWYAVASVKWLADIRVVEEPFQGFFQAARYVYERDRGGVSTSEPVRLQRVRALITRPGSGQELACGGLIVRGVAWSGAAPIERVEVSVAGGRWQKARLVGVAAAHGWQQWAETSLLPNYGLPEDTLKTMLRKGAIQPGSLHRILVIGPGLDFTDKRDGYDFYPIQTIQPFAMLEAVARLGLGKAEEISVVTADLNAEDVCCQDGGTRASGPAVHGAAAAARFGGVEPGGRGLLAEVRRNSGYAGEAAARSGFW